MSKQSKRRRSAQQKGPLFTTPIQEKSSSTGEILGNGSAKQAAFLAAYALCGAIGQAAKAANCDRRSHIDWMKNDPNYRDRFAIAQDAANEVLEREARRRAVKGVEKMKFYKGEPIYVIDETTGRSKPYVEHEYSDALLTLLLKAHMHDKYAEQKKIESVTTILDPAVQAALIEFNDAEPLPEQLTELQETDPIP